MSKIRDSVRISKYVKAPSTATTIIATDRVQPGQSLVVQSVSWKNATGARGTASLGIRAMSQVFPLSDQPLPAAGEWYTYPYEQHLKPGEEVIVSQAGVQADDELYLEVIGYIQFLDAEGGPG